MDKEVLYSEVKLSIKKNKQTNKKTLSTAVIVC